MLPVTFQNFSNALLLILSLLCLCQDFIQARQVYVQNAEWYRTPGNPGVKIRLTKKGINQLKTVGVKLLNEQISQLQGYSTSFPFQNGGLEGYAQLSNLRVLHFNPATVSVVNYLPPRYVIFGLENMDISMASDFFGSAGPFQAAGSVDGSLTGLTVALTVDFFATQDGQMAIQIANCSTVIGKSHFTLYPQGPTGPLIKTMEGFINQIISQRIPGMLCRKLKNLIELNSPKLVSKITKTYFDKHFTEDKLNLETPVMKKFAMDLVKGLYIDNRNIDQPYVSYDYFETRQRGEVRYENRTETTPFFPKPMYTSPTDSDRMLYFYGSDYIFNSLLYHAYQTNKLTLTIRPDNIPDKYRSMLTTSCLSKPGQGFSSGVCVGKLIPALATAYPNKTMSFILIPHGLPGFRFNKDAGAINLSTRLLAYVDDNGQSKQVMVASCSGQADVVFSAANDRLSGDLKLNKLNIRLHRSAVQGIDPEAIEQLTPLAKTFIGPQLSQSLKKGVPFPLKGTVDFVDTTLETYDGYIALATDFEINEDAMRQKMTEAFKDLQS